VLGRGTTPYSISVIENPNLTTNFSKISVTLAAVQGEAQTFWPVSFPTPSTTPYILTARFSDNANIVRISQPSQTVSASWNSTNDVSLVVAPNLAPGKYTGTLDLVFCRDANCTKMYRGVSRLPYTVTVMATSNLKPLTALTGATDWRTLQGGSEHTGYVPATLNPANFSQRWQWKATDANINYLSEAVTAGGSVLTLATPSPTYHLTPVLNAIDEASGTVTWSQLLPDGVTVTSGGLGFITPPAIIGSNVYVTSTAQTYPNSQGLTFAFHVSNGVQHFAPRLSTQMPTGFGNYFHESAYTMTNSQSAYMTPGADSLVLEVSESSGGGQKFVTLDSTTGAIAAPWSSCPSVNNFTNSPAGAVAIDGNQNVFVAAANGLAIANTCQFIGSAVAIGNGYGPMLVPNSPYVVVVGSGNLVAFDTATMQLKWSFGDTSRIYVGSPAVADNTVYVANNGSTSQIEARRVSDGELLWSWKSPWSDDQSFIGNIVATQNLLFVSARTRVYAIDRATREIVWMYPYGGFLSLSANGILYIARGGPFSPASTLVAVNLH
jgi:hypothetical protein